jgi:hypothetical protein
MSITRAVMLLAGSFVLLSVLLAWLVHPLWILLAVFVGLNLAQSSFTGFCPAAMIFRKLGLKGGL